MLYTGRLAILKDRVEAFVGTQQNIKVNDIKFTYLENNKVVKLSELKGKVVLINFWATWCPPCKIEIPGFVELYDKYNENGFEIIGVSVDTSGSDSVKSFVKSEKINYPVVMADKELAEKFDEIVAIPTSFLINQKGEIVKKYSGLYMKSTFENDIKKLLENS